MFGPLLACFDAILRKEQTWTAPPQGKNSLASCFFYCQPELHCLSLACDRCHRLHLHRPRLWVRHLRCKHCSCAHISAVLRFLRPRLSRVETAPPAGIPVDRSSRVQLTEHPEKFGPLLPCFDTVFRKSKCAERRRHRKSSLASCFFSCQPELLRAKRLCASIHSTYMTLST